MAENGTQLDESMLRFMPALEAAKKRQVGTARGICSTACA